MRIRKRENIQKKNSLITLLYLLPIIGILIYGAGILYIVYDINSFTYEIDPPNDNYFYPLEDIDMDRLEEMALIFDQRNYEINSPVGFPVDVTFKNRSYIFDAIEEWHGTDNGAAHTSYAIAAAACKHKVAVELGDKQLIENASKELRRYVQAFCDMIAAPNGGLGINPETDEYYPGVISRFACSYEDCVRYHPFLLEDHVRHHNGTGKYSNWRIRMKTSRDEVCGYYLGWAAVLKCVDPSVNDDSEWCVEQTKTMVDQVLHHWIYESNWLVLDYDGSPTGSDLNTEPWKLIALRIGATAYPEKYGSMYHYAASKMLSMGAASMGEMSNAGMEYFAFMAAHKSMFPLIILEDDPSLLHLYIKNYQQGVYNIIKYHRNAFFNIVHLIFMSLLDEKDQQEFENPEYNDNMVKWDVLDQLWRFHASNWCPIRNYNLTERPHSTRSTSLNPEIRKKMLDPTREKWLSFFNTHPAGWMYSWMIDVFKMDKEIFLVPSTISEHWAHHNMWQSNPFQGEGGDPDGDGLREPPGTTYTMVYWMGRAFDIF